MRGRIGREDESCGEGMNRGVHVSCSIDNGNDEARLKPFPTRVAWSFHIDVEE